MDSNNNCAGIYNNNVQLRRVPAVQVNKELSLPDKCRKDVGKWAP